MKYDTFNDTAGEKSYIQNILNVCIKISHILNLEVKSKSYFDTLSFDIIFNISVGFYK